MSGGFCRRIFATCGGIGVFAAVSAQAAPLTPSQILTQFNLIVFGSLDSTSSVEGRTLVGDDLTGSSSDYFTRGNLAAPSDFGALTVGGNVSGGFKNVNNGGNAGIAGNVANMNMNGGTAFIAGSITGTVNGNKQTGAAVLVPDVEPAMTQLAADLLGLAANSSVTVASNKATFTAAPDAAGQAVFAIADGQSFFNSFGEIAFALNGADTVIVNVGGTNITLADNFLGGIGSTIAPKVLWNFHAADTISVTAEFFGTVLAPAATLTNSSALNGSIVVGDMTQRAQVHLPVFAGDLPAGAGVAAPPALLLFAGALALLAALRRRRA